MRLVLAALIIAIAGTAAADSCFRRIYTESHMDRNPKQTVTQMEVRFTEGADQQAFVRVTFRDSVKVWTGQLFCWPVDQAEFPGATIGCSVECDGGLFTVKPKDRSILLTTKGGFMVGATCGDDDVSRWVTDRGAAKTTYRLDPADAATCY